VPATPLLAPAVLPRLDGLCKAAMPQPAIMTTVNVRDSCPVTRPSWCLLVGHSHLVPCICSRPVCVSICDQGTLETRRVPGMTDISMAATSLHQQYISHIAPPPDKDVVRAEITQDSCAIQAGLDTSEGGRTCLDQNCNIPVIRIQLHGQAASQGVAEVEYHLMIDRCSPTSAPLLLPPMTSPAQRMQM
jgi:hypothetical protein